MTLEKAAPFGSVDSANAERGRGIGAESPKENVVRKQGADKALVDVPTSTATQSKTGVPVEQDKKRSPGEGKAMTRSDSTQFHVDPDFAALVRPLEEQELAAIEEGAKA